MKQKAIPNHPKPKHRKKKIQGICLLLKLIFTTLSAKPQGSSRDKTLHVDDYFRTATRLEVVVANLSVNNNFKTATAPQPNSEEATVKNQPESSPSTTPKVIIDNIESAPNHGENPTQNTNQTQNKTQNTKAHIWII